MKSKNTWQTDGLEDWLPGVLKEEVREIVKLNGGINSQTYQVIAAQNTYAAKVYLRKSGDSRDRLNTEFGTLSFFWEQGIRSIPEPILKDPSRQTALYRFIEGQKLLPDQICAADLDQTADFVLQLRRLSVLPEAGHLPEASEACFSLQEYFSCLDRRIARLQSVGDRALSRFLDHDLGTTYAQWRRRVTVEAGKEHLDLAQGLAKPLRTLSPSDFGFHNILKSVDGRIFFLDFEYCGWDDPVKLIADFYLQPGVPLPLPWRKYFYDKIRPCFPEGPSLERRLRWDYPLLGIKWCLIMLNPFLNNEIKFQAAEVLQRSSEKLEQIKSEMAMNIFPLGGRL